MKNIINICWFVYFLYWAVTAFFTKKSAEKKTPWKRIETLRLLLAIVLLYFIIKKGPSSLELHALFGFVIFKSTFTFHIVGSIITVAGLLGALWARTVLGRNWSGYVTYKENHELVTNGPYKFVRHPIYLSILLMLLGTFVYTGIDFVLGMIIIASFVFITRVFKEEKIMIELFGDRYKDYMKETYTLIPGVY